MMHAWLYLRKSRDEENDPEILSGHRAELLRLATHDGITIPEENILAEIGSADEIESRPVFRRLLALWERLPRQTGGVIYSTEVSRLTRGLQSQQGRVQDALARAGIRHRTRSRWYDLAVPDDCTAWELEGFIARMENRNFKARVRAAWDQMLMDGKIRNGQAPYGYRWDKAEKTLVAHPERFETLCRCCREVRDTSVKELARRWRVPENTLLAALKNPVICGWPALRHGPRDPRSPRRDDYCLLPRHQWTWPERENCSYPHACTRAEWEAIQQAIDARRKSPSHTDYREGWCRDVVWFPQNPGPCHLSVYTFSRGEKRRRFLTYERRSRGQKALYIDRELVHTTAYERIAALFGEPQFLALALAEETETILRREQEGAREIAALSRAIDLKRRRYQEAVDAQMDADELNLRLALSERRKRLGDELSQLQADLIEIQSCPTRAQELRLILQDLPPTLQDFPTVWTQMDGFTRRRLVNAVLRQITVEITPLPRAHQRRITGAFYHDWLGPFLHW